MQGERVAFHHLPKEALVLRHKNYGLPWGGVISREILNILSQVPSSVRSMREL